MQCLRGLFKKLTYNVKMALILVFY